MKPLTYRIVEMHGHYFGLAWSDDGKMLTTQSFPSYTGARASLSSMVEDTHEYTLKYFDGEHQL